MVHRVGLAAFAAAIAILVSPAGVIQAGTEPGGDEEDVVPVVIELTLSGTVDRGDTFGIYRLTDSPMYQFIHDLEVVCSGEAFQQKLYSYPECAQQTYRLSYGLPAGSTLEYGIVRWTGALHGDLAEYLLRDSVTIPEGGIALRLGYDYSLVARPALPTLPDTAVPRSVHAAQIGLGLLALSLLLWR